MTCQPPVSRLTVPSGASSSRATDSMPSPPALEAYRWALIGPWIVTDLVRGLVENTAPALSLSWLSEKQGSWASSRLGTPAVHWLADRVQRPAAGIGRMLDVPVATVPDVRPPGAPSSADVPDSLSLAPVRDGPIHFVLLAHAPVPCS